MGVGTRKQVLRTPGLLGRSWVAFIYLPLRGRINSWRRGSSAAWEALVESLSKQAGRRLLERRGQTGRRCAVWKVSILPQSHGSLSV